MRSSPTDSRSSEDPRQGQAEPVYLWAWDAPLAARFRRELGPAAARLATLPPRGDWEAALAGGAGVLIAAAGEEALPLAEELAALRQAGGRLVVLLPAADERTWRRLIRRGFHEVLAPPFAGLDLALLFADAERALALDRRLPEFDARVRTRVDFSLPAELRFVTPAAAFLCRLAREHGFHPQVWAEALPLALDEALANAIRHGCALDSEKEVRVSARFGPRRLRVRIADPGAGFDPTRVGDPMSEEGLRRGSGRGLLLMRELVDRVDYRQGGRVVLLTVRRVRRPRDEES